MRKRKLGSVCDNLHSSSNMRLRTKKLAVSLSSGYNVRKGIHMLDSYNNAVTCALCDNDIGRSPIPIHLCRIVSSMQF
jgi:hypothetical protein